MPLMSPLKMPGACSVRSVLPPSRKDLPSKTALSGRCVRWWVPTSSAARLFAATMSREQGMYFTLPVEVPDDTAK